MTQEEYLVGAYTDEKSALGVKDVGRFVVDLAVDQE